MTAADTNWTVVARIVRPQGRHGELLADLFTDFPESFSRRERLFLLPQGEGSASEAREAKLESHWLHKGRVVLKFAGVDSIGDAEKLRGLRVAVPREERVPLTGDAVYIEDLVGARVVNVSGGRWRDAGEIIDVLPQAAGPAMLAVRAGDSEPALIPFVKAYLKKIDLEARRLEMDLPEGLMDINAPMTGEERQRMREESEREESDPEKNEEAR